MPHRRRRHHRSQEKPPEPVFNLVDIIAQAEAEAIFGTPPQEPRDGIIDKDAESPKTESVAPDYATDLDLRHEFVSKGVPIESSSYETSGLVEKTPTPTPTPTPLLLLDTVDLMERRVKRRRHRLDGWSGPGPGDGLCANILILIITILMCLLSPLSYLSHCWQSRRATILNGESIDVDEKDL